MTRRITLPPMPDVIEGHEVVFPVLVDWFPDEGYRTIIEVVVPRPPPVVGTHRWRKSLEKDAYECGRCGYRVGGVEVHREMRSYMDSINMEWGRAARGSENALLGEMAGPCLR